MREIEIKIKDTNMHFGFISTQANVPTWNNFRSGKIQNQPHHKIDFIASDLRFLLYLFINIGKNL